MVFHNNIWAIVVGVDYYSPDPKDNLNGCVRDAEAVHDLLRDQLHVSESNLEVFLAPEPTVSTTITTFQPPLGAEILRALRDVKSRARAGDLVWFHYSGHGDRMPSNFPTLKTDTKLDEVLCAIDDDIRDVEIDEVLSDLTSAGLNVLAVLDCCHSGGATRDGEGSKVRCRSLAQRNESLGRTENLRNATVKETWFYRQRKYHVVAACQPYQFAKERVDSQGVIHGALTIALLKAFRSSGNVLDMRYRTLQQLIDAEFPFKLSQQPMILGDAEASVGGNTLSSSTQARVTVSKVGIDTLTLDKGAASGLDAGDQYEVLSPSQLKSSSKQAIGINLVITKVAGMTAEVHKADVFGDFTQIEIGWLGRLKHKAQKVFVDVLMLPDGQQHGKKAIGEFLQQLATTTDVEPFEFRFAPDGGVQSESATFAIAASSEGYIDVFGSQKQRLAPIPRIDIAAENLLEKIIALLRHLHGYISLEQMKSPVKRKKPNYQFQILDVPLENSAVASGALAAKQVVFKNLESRPVYVTIFNLTSTWGVHRIFPFDDDSSLVVEPGLDIPELIVDIEVPSILRSDAKGDAKSQKMRDVLKIFITVKQVSFDHFKLRDLDAGLTGVRSPLRKAIAQVPQEFEWYCDQVEFWTPFEVSPP